MSALRIAALIRVSTERQEQQGESLRTQRHSIERSVAQLKGTLVGWYGGQEHATPGWEHAEVDRLLADAKAGKFDAVVVAYADRWSRDNGKSKAGLDTLRQAGVKFFVGGMDMDLFDPQHRFMLGMNAEVGEFIALQQAKKSMESRIERARRGYPSSGRLPYGRTFDRDSGQWGIDPGKAAMVRDAAQRYLAGESLVKIAQTYGVDYGYLLEVISQLSGPTWQQRFNSDSLNIHEVVETAIPELLDETTRAAILERVDANKTYRHGHIVHRYLLSRMLFCRHCGYAVYGDSRNGHRYYRHDARHRQRACPLPKTRIRADDLERDVFGELFEMFGGAVALQRSIAAIEAAIPDRARVEDMRQRLTQVRTDLGTVAQQRSRLIDAITDGIVPAAQARTKREQLDDRERLLRDELAQLDSELADLPTQEQVISAAQQAVRSFRRLSATAQIEQWDGPDAMSYEDRRQLVEMVLGGRRNGARLGVYLDWRGGYQIRGRVRADAGPRQLLKGMAEPQGTKSAMGIPDRSSSLPFLLEIPAKSA